MPFNRRGHDSVSTYDSRECVGGAYQTVAEGVEDNKLAAKYLASKGFTNPIVIGHSNGGVLASEHVANHPGDQSANLAIRPCRREPNDQSDGSAQLFSGGKYRRADQRSQGINGRRQTAATHAHPGLVMGDLSTNLPRPPHQRARFGRERQADQMPRPLHPRRPGTGRKLSRRTLQRKLLRPVRSRDCVQLRPLLRRRGREGLEDCDGLAKANSRLAEPFASPT